jgi:hypothetical protein
MTSLQEVNQSATCGRPSDRELERHPARSSADHGEWKGRLDRKYDRTIVRLSRSEQDASIDSRSVLFARAITICSDCLPCWSDKSEERYAEHMALARHSSAIPHERERSIDFMTSNRPDPANRTENVGFRLCLSLVRISRTPQWP